MMRGASIAFALAVLAVAVRPAAAGPFGADDGGVHMTSSVFTAWIDDVVSLQLVSGGGYARNDDFESCPPAEAVRGRPAGYEEAAEANNAHVLSLGNGGSVVLRFNGGIGDGPGPDFAVFENGFTDQTPRAGDTNRHTFAELAFVEVGSSTSAWARFPSAYLGTGLVYNLNHTPSNHYASQDVTLIDGLAGKHTVQYGTPFDLALLRDHPAVVQGDVDLDAIRYVRLIDVIGSGATFDASNRPIRDPYYNFQKGYPFVAPVAQNDGFDLRAIGVIHAPGVRIEAAAGGPRLRWFAPAGHLFRVQYADLAAPGEWHDLEPEQAGQDGWLQQQDAGGAGRMYRVVRREAP